MRWTLTEAAWMLGISRRYLITLESGRNGKGHPIQPNGAIQRLMYLYAQGHLINEGAFPRPKPKSRSQVAKRAKAGHSEQPITDWLG